MIKYPVDSQQWFSEYAGPERWRELGKKEEN